jgi:hypothetical protein
VPPCDHPISTAPFYLDYHNIGHDWQFNNEQQERLQQYYDTNQFLVELLQTSPAVSDAVREEIEATLLLPIPVPQEALASLHWQEAGASLSTFI